MASTGVFFGIDLGTSNSSIVYAVDDPRYADSPIRPVKIVLIPMKERGDPDRASGRLPSVVYCKAARKILVGFPADEGMIQEKGQRGRDVFFSTKSDMGTNLAYPEAKIPELNTPPKVAAAILKRLIRAAQEQSGTDPRRNPTVVTVPASFDSAQRADTLEAARLAGLQLEEGHLLDEPMAAFLGFVNTPDFGRIALPRGEIRNVLVFDYGGGTCDVSILSVALDPDARPLGLRVVNLAISNYEQLGGDRIDRLVAEEHLLPAVCEKSGIAREELTPDEVEDFLEMHLRIGRSLKEHLATKIAERVGRLPNLAWRNLRSSPVTERITTRRVKLADNRLLDPASVTLSSPEFAELVEYLFSLEDVRQTEFGYSCKENQLVRPILSALKKAGLRFEDIDHVLMTGGSCRLPFVWHLLAELFTANKILPVDEFDFAVCQGAAFHCHFRHTRGRPVIYPVAVDELGVVTYGEQYERLVAIGKALPFPMEGGYHTVTDRFCLPADEMQMVRVSLYAGREGERRVVQNYEWKLPPETHKGDSVVVQVRIDENKLTHLRAFLASDPDHFLDEKEGGLWEKHVPGPEETPLIEARQTVRKLCDNGLRVPPEKLVNLAIWEYRNDHCERARRILRSVIRDSPTLPSAQNALGLCYWRSGHLAQGVAAFRKAVEFDPKNTIYLGNLGGILTELNRVAEAENVLRSAVDVDPDSYYPYEQLGGLYRKMGDEAKAQREWEQAERRLRARLARAPNDFWTLQRLAYVLHAQGKYVEADSHYKRLRQLEHESIFQGSPDELLAGPSSGIWHLSAMEGES